MYPIHRILVAVKDPDAKATPAVAKAAQLARALGAEIRLFHGLTDPVLVDAAGRQASGVAMFGAERQAHCRERLEAIAKPLRRRGVQVTSAVEWDFPAHEAICRQAAQFEADLIIAEAHPRPHHAPWLLRFADWELLRCSSLPVLLVKSARPYRRPRVLAAIDPGHAFAKPTNLDGEILHYASTVADALHGTLCAVHAYDPTAIALSMRPADVAAPKARERIEQAELARVQGTLRATLESAGVPDTPTHLIGRHPTDAILDVAAATGARILAMGAISRSGLKRLFIGNTAEKLLDRIDCDVLVVKSRQFRNRITRARRGMQLVTMPWDRSVIL
jgi:universal stress protein E